MAPTSTKKTKAVAKKKTPGATKKKTATSQRSTAEGGGGRGRGVADADAARALTVLRAAPSPVRPPGGAVIVAPPPDRPPEDEDFIPTFLPEGKGPDKSNWVLTFNDSLKRVRVSSSTDSYALQRFVEGRDPVGFVSSPRREKGCMAQVSF